MTIPQPPPGQGPVDPRGAFSQPPPPPGGGGGGWMPPPGPPPGMYGAPPPPPMMMMPPPFYPPPPPRGGSFVRGIFMTLATSIFGLSIMLNLYLLISAGIFSDGDAVKQVTVIPGDSTQKVAVIRVNGIIMESMARRIDGTLRKIEQDKNVKALVVEVDTPGGEVGPSDEIYHRLNLFKENKHVPVVVAMGGFATSGGYYISCAADEIVAQRTTITGNIGVLWPRYNLSKLADKWGIEDQTIYPPDAPYKPMGSELKAMDQKEYEYWLGLVNDAYGTFKSVVQTGRAGKLKSGMDVVANGKAYSATESLQMGLIDKIGYSADAYDAAAKLAGLNSKEVVRYEYLPSFLDVLAGGNAQSSSLGSAKLMEGGVSVNLKIDREVIDELTTPRLMYMWRGQ